MNKPAAADEKAAASAVAAEAEPSFPWSPEGRKAYPGSEERTDNWQKHYASLQKCYANSCGLEQSQVLEGSGEMATLSEANALQKLLRRKFRPQMRWWMQKLHKPSNQRGARMRSLFPAGTQISLGIPSSSDVQIPESQDFLDIQARILGRQHGNSGSFFQPWNQKHKAVRELL